MKRNDNQVRRIMKELLVSAFFILHFAFLIPLSAQCAESDSLLYFMVDAYDVSGSKNFDYAMIGVADSYGPVKDGSGNVYLSIRPNQSQPADPGTVIAWSDAARYTTNPQWAEFGDYANAAYSFYVETYVMDSDTPIWSYDPSSIMSYSELLAANHVYFTNSTAEQNPTVWVIPEPSGGILFLLGFAVLGLRRRRLEVEG